VPRSRPARRRSRRSWPGPTSWSRTATSRSTWTSTPNWPSCSARR